MNDHHFHYGYWVKAAAHVALRGTVGLGGTQHNWAALVEKISRSIATDDARPAAGLPLPA